jgi:hypothetical protein
MCHESKGLLDDARGDRCMIFAERCYIGHRPPMTVHVTMTVTTVAAATLRGQYSQGTVLGAEPFGPCLRGADIAFKDGSHGHSHL